ncbi:potassium/proton antiporter membrane subunit (CPA2 family) [Haloactinopolyspora alba]|uniref:Potassium/proton antiporter membrane subunit (CPA2 family) n=1 Tax=Haloactinopolyspora alba TaxID=648780 RepID=A0A2P8DLZ5_9ACTN|nr:cation:proton antiporter [Haloactinopolyspora alba]PSK98218.1 potassium/proton antiporter membrane subunit (CPA2 family) [Haloactinopolyspora alba]
MHETTMLLIEVGALLLGIGLLGRLAGRIGLSPIPVYLAAGLAFGQGGLAPLSAGAEFFEVGSEIGVILLLVMLGLEYSADELVTNIRRSALAGVLDGVLNALPGAAFALLLGWGPVAAVALAGITWISSSGVIAKVLRDLGRLSNRETPVVLSILVIEDLAMAFYLPVLSALVVGAGLLEGTRTLVIAVAAVVLILYLALRHGHLISTLFSPKEPESLLLGVLGLTMLVAGLADRVNVSAAVGAFLVGIAISGPVALHASQVLTPLRDLFAAVFFVFFGLATDLGEVVPVLVPALALAVVTMATKVLTGYFAARRAGIAVPGRWRTGLVLTPRGEFSVVIAGLAVSAGVEPRLAAMATAYVLITVVGGPLLARLPDSARFKAAVRRRREVRALT